MASSTSLSVSLDRVFPVLAVADLDAAVSYYTESLGFEEVWRWGEPPSRVGVARDDVEIQLVLAGLPCAPPGRSVVYCHVRGVEAYHAACVRDGADISLDLGWRGFGLRDFRVRDLDGNILGFGELDSSERETEPANDLA